MKDFPPRHFLMLSEQREEKQAFTFLRRPQIGQRMNHPLISLVYINFHGRFL